MYINSNDQLANLDGLEALSSVGADLVVIDNPGLGDCAGMAPVLGWPTLPYDETADGVAGIASIFNAPGAQSPDDCLEAYGIPPVPPPVPAVPVPALPPWGLAVLAGILGVVGLRRLQGVC